MRLIKELPEVADHRRRQHHRQHDDRGPQVVALEFLVDQIGECEADQHLKKDRPEQEVRGRLHVQPDVAVGQDTLVIAQADVLHLAPRAVGFEIGKAEPDGPDQRKDVDGQQQEYRGADEDPRNGAVA